MGSLVGGGGWSRAGVREEMPEGARYISKDRREREEMLDGSSEEEETRRDGTHRVDPQDGKVSVRHVSIVFFSLLRTRRNGIHDALIEASSFLEDRETSVDESGLTLDLGGWRDENERFEA